MSEKNSKDHTPLYQKPKERVNIGDGKKQEDKKGIPLASLEMQEERARCVKYNCQVSAFGIERDKDYWMTAYFPKSQIEVGEAEIVIPAWLYRKLGENFEKRLRESGI